MLQNIGRFSCDLHWNYDYCIEFQTDYQIIEFRASEMFEIFCFDPFLDFSTILKEMLYYVLDEVMQSFNQISFLLEMEIFGFQA